MSEGAKWLYCLRLDAVDAPDLALREAPSQWGAAKGTDMAKQTARALKNEYLRIVKEQKGDVPGRLAADAYLHSLGFGEDGNDFSWSAIPVLLNEQAMATLDGAARTMGIIMEKVMAKYHRDRSFRALFSLPSDIEALTLVPSGCHAAVPLSRVDLFLDPKTFDFKICGIQTGGVEGMAESVEVMRAIRQTGPYHEFASRHQTETMDAMKACVLTLLHTYGNWANAQEGRNHPTNPALAIVDIKDSPRRAETEYAIKYLHELGCYAHAADVSELRIERIGGIDQLVDDHGPVTCVWIRPTAEEAIAHMDKGIHTLLRATRHGMVCTIGGYRSWPCCVKSFFEVLRTNDCRTLLTAEENAFVEAHIIESHVIEPSIDLSAFYEQENWVLCQADGRAVMGTVLAGADMDRATWRKMLVKGIKRRDAVQASIPQHTMGMLPGVPGEADPCKAVEMNVLLGTYVFEGKLSGMRAICGTGNTVAVWKDRTAAGCLIVHK